MRYPFKIDEKSLFVGVKNDYSRGQSATVHTPLNQAKNKKDWHNDIYDFLEGYNSIENLPERLKDLCLKKTTSKAPAKIVHFCVFSKFSVDGVHFDVDKSFAMYVKEETGDIIKKRVGVLTANTHKGRQKLHYPKNFAYCSDGFNIDNNVVLKKILEVNGGFAYVVNGFDYDDQTETLNFRTTMVGLEGVLLSDVFIRKKGVGKKLIVDGTISQMGISNIPKGIISDEEENKFLETLEKIQESSRANGRIGEEYVINNLTKILRMEFTTPPIHISDSYPLSPYDIECTLNNGNKLYIEVKSTQGSKKEFIMSKGERQFMDKYCDRYLLILVTNVKAKNKKHFKYRREEIMNDDIMRKDPQGIKFIVR